ncbi:DNA polymerase III PolC-type [Corynebacterium ciconiae DSM 44920]|uniref:exonuclease domain-containing protein n=1 Tax=Corynebacterium ciconiae TaxID=227319 RepID=UPI000377CA5E|nr:exonuclease domain-containing protein [Corynebacterium ciconiae]WKD61049.1 DNA polymerase III PolC-type [Corynebacterium ciconiae DSM 44920]
MFGWRAKKATGVLAEFNATAQHEAHVPLDEAELLAVDIETTGLHPSKDKMLSVGWVPVRGRQIRLEEAGYLLIKQDRPVGISATLHHLTDTQLATGHSPRRALEEFLPVLAGTVMLVHFAPIEQRFLSALCEQEFGAPLRVPTADTFQLERTHMEKMSTYPRGEDLRLPRVRARYNLPRYRNHNALIDAIACAELYLAMRAHRGYETVRDILA